MLHDGNLIFAGRTGAGQVQDNEQDSVDLATASTLLGLTAETIRKRLQRGKIKGFKAAGGAWRVVLDKVDSKQDSLGQTAGREQDKPGQEDSALVQTLREDIQFLRSQLLSRDEEIRRVHVLLQQEQQQVKALADQRERRPWWRRWWS
jgi:hypothetical protein